MFIYAHAGTCIVKHTHVFHTSKHSHKKTQHTHQVGSVTKKIMIMVPAAYMYACMYACMHECMHMLCPGDGTQRVTSIACMYACMYVLCMFHVFVYEIMVKPFVTMCLCLCACGYMLVSMHAYHKSRIRGEEIMFKQSLRKRELTFEQNAEIHGTLYSRSVRLLQRLAKVSGMYFYLSGRYFIIFCYIEKWCKCKCA
jgi:hypothetical protein